MKAIRVVVAALLLLASFPLFYFGLYGVLSLIYGHAETSWLVLCTVATALLPLNLLGVVYSPRHIPLFALSIAIMYAGWAFSIFPFPGNLPLNFVWTVYTIIVLAGLNVIWTAFTLRRLGFGVSNQAQVFAQTLVFWAVFYVAVVGWAHPLGLDNLPVATLIWSAALVAGGLNLLWTVRCHRRVGLRIRV